MGASDVDTILGWCLRWWRRADRWCPYWDSPAQRGPGVAAVRGRRRRVRTGLEVG